MARAMAAAARPYCAGVPPPDVIALFGPTGVGKTAVALALAQRLRERGEDPVAVSADALQVYSGLEILTGAATAPSARCSSIGCCRFCPSMRASAPASTPSSPTPRSTRCSPRAAGRSSSGGTGLYLRAALTELSLRPPPAEGVREQWVAELELRGPHALHALLARRAPWAAEQIDPGDRQRIVRALELYDAGELEPPRRRLRAVDRRRAPPDAARRADHGARGALCAHRCSGCEQMLAAGAVQEVRRAHAAGASATARKALGFEELLAGDVEAMQRRTRNYARRQLTWMRKLAGGAHPRHHRPGSRRHRRGRAGTLAQLSPAGQSHSRVTAAFVVPSGDFAGIRGRGACGPLSLRTRWTARAIRSA